jgi:hypothetical protein
MPSLSPTKWFINWLRVGPRSAVAQASNQAFFETDLTGMLPAVGVPALLLFRKGRRAEEGGTLAVVELIGPQHCRQRIPPRTLSAQTLTSWLSSPTSGRPPAAGW